MSGCLTHLSRAFFRWGFMFTLPIASFGCSAGFYKAYVGPGRPLEEVAVLFVDEDSRVFAEKIDGNPLPWFPSECHLLPGEHSVTAHYYGNFWSSGPLGRGDAITLSYDFSKGDVYYLECSWREGGFTGALWSLHIMRRGSVQGIAAEQSKKWFAPPHWRELAERQPPN